MRNIFKSIVFFLIIFQYVNTYSQNSEYSSRNNIIQHFDSIYGADNLLINGRIFMYPNSRAKGNPFFFGKDTKLCDLYIKNRKFSNLLVNYNIAEDKLIVLSQINNNNIRIELSSHLIDSFFISHYVISNNFIQNPSTFSSDVSNTFNMAKELIFTKKFISLKKNGYFERIYEGNDRLLKKYLKTFSDKVSQEYPYGTFTDQKTILYLYRNGKTIDVSNKRKFLTAFILYKKEINKFLRENKIKYKNADNIELIKLMNYSEELK